MERTQTIDNSNRERVHEEITNAVHDMLKQSMRPEFLNRIDDIIVFHALSKENIKEIVQLQMRAVADMLHEKGLTIVLNDDAQNFLAEQSYDPAFGARPLKRLIQKLIINPLAVKIIEGQYKSGDSIQVGKKENSLDFL